MAVVPLKHKKIIKKIKKGPRRFQSHEYKRVDVSLQAALVASPAIRFVTLIFNWTARPPQKSAWY